jgi:hypothetical protein
MKRKKQKKIDWSQVPWTEFEPCQIPMDGLNAYDKPEAIFRNSRYQVTVYVREPRDAEHSVFGVIAHLSFKVHDKQPHHDWRDMQRIKNEICGPEFDAVEIFPAESKLVDSANQYHLFVFQTYKLPFGFQTRLVGDGNWQSSVQRPFPPGERPADCLSADQYQAAVDDAVARMKAGRSTDLSQE